MSVPPFALPVVFRSGVGLKPLTKTQRHSRKQSIEQTLKNISVIKMAAAAEPEVPTRLHQPLQHWRSNWMRNKLAAGQELLVSAGPPSGTTSSSIIAGSPLARLRAAFSQHHATTQLHK